MKNKKNIYFLLPAVLLIWGFLGYRIFSPVQTNTTHTNLAITDIVFKPNAFKESAPFTIKANYRDPFLGTTAAIKPKVTFKPQQLSKLPFPQVIYKGVVSSSNRQEVFIVNIDGKQYFFKKYQTHQGVKLISSNSKSITLKFQGQQQTFPLANKASL